MTNWRYHPFPLLEHSKRYHHVTTPRYHPTPLLKKAKRYHPMLPLITTRDLLTREINTSDEGFNVVLVLSEGMRLGFIFRLDNFLVREKWKMNSN